MSLIGIIHTVLAFVALAAGLAIFVLAKGTRQHRMVGYIYVIAMLGMNVTALMIYRLFGRFGPFHVFAIMSLATVVIGFVPALTKRPAQTWLHWHYNWILWSYIGLLAALASEVLTRVPIFDSGGGFALAVLAASALVIIIGAYIVRRKKDAIMARMAIILAQRSA